MRSVVPRICAGACRASSIVSSALVVTPAPATVRNRRRLTEALTGTGRGSLIADLLVERSNSREEPPERVTDGFFYPVTATRSEERRVGKECRYRWWG